MRWTFLTLLTALGASAEAAPVSALDPALLPAAPTARLSGGPGIPGPQMTERTEEVVLRKRTETSRRGPTGADASAAVDGDLLAVTVSVRDTCLEREVQEVRLITTAHPTRGEEARKTTLGLGVGSLAIAGIGAVAPYDGVDPLVGRVFYVGVFGGLGVFGLVRASQLRTREVGSRVVQRPQPWRESPCPGDPEGLAVQVQARVDGRTVDLVETRLDADGRGQGPIEPGASRLVERAATLRPGKEVDLIVHIDGQLSATTALPPALAARVDAPRRRHAASEFSAALADARRARGRGDFEDAREWLREARHWAWGEADDARLREAAEAVSAAADRGVRQSWPGREARALAVCRRVHRSVSTFKRTTNQLARTDADAAQRHIDRHKDRVQRELEEMGEAVEDLSRILDEMREYGSSDADVRRFAGRVSGACGG